MENVNFPIGLMYWIFLTLSCTGWHIEHEKSWIPVCDEKKKQLESQPTSVDVTKKTESFTTRCLHRTQG